MPGEQHPQHALAIEIAELMANLHHQMTIRQDEDRAAAYLTMTSKELEQVSYRLRSIIGLANLTLAPMDRWLHQRREEENATDSS